MTCIPRRTLDINSVREFLRRRGYPADDRTVRRYLRLMSDTAARVKSNKRKVSLDKNV